MLKDSLKKKVYSDYDAFDLKVQFLGGFEQVYNINLEEILRNVEYSTTTIILNIDYT